MIVFVRLLIIDTRCNARSEKRFLNYAKSINYFSANNTVTKTTKKPPLRILIINCLCCKMKVGANWNVTGTGD